jgi:hypothetical protein
MREEQSGNDGSRPAAPGLEAVVLLRIGAFAVFRFEEAACRFSSLQYMATDRPLSLLALPMRFSLASCSSSSYYLPGALQGRWMEEPVVANLPYEHWVIPRMQLTQVVAAEPLQAPATYFVAHGLARFVTDGRREAGEQPPLPIHRLPGLKV